MYLARNIFLNPLPGKAGWPIEGPGPLTEVLGFGSNPGNLRMFVFVPARLQHPRPLVVVLHGCGQTAASYGLGAGWPTLAEHYGFALLLAQQRPSNNPRCCFNWYNSDDIAPGQGEACSIRQMVERMTRDNGIDPRRVFVTGLSAGGSMASVMLAAYPEVFAAGAVIAGLPFGVAGNVREALSVMRAGSGRPAAELGDLVRDASMHRGPFPKVSVWHGSADRVVSPANAAEIVKQWLDVHRLPPAPMSEAVVEGYPRQIWWNAGGETVVESYIITDMAHGTPLGVAEDDTHYGRKGAFLLEAGISSSYHIAKFFGLTGWIGWIGDARPAAPASPVKAVSPRPADAASDRAGEARGQAPARERGTQKAAPSRRPRLVGVRAVIRRALTGAKSVK